MTRNDPKRIVDWISIRGITNPPADTDVLVSDGEHITIARWTTKEDVWPNHVWYSADSDFEPEWWMPLPEIPGKDTT